MTPNDSDILLYRIAFSLVKGVNVSTGRRLLELIGTPRDFFYDGPAGVHPRDRDERHAFQ